MPRTPHPEVALRSRAGAFSIEGLRLPRTLGVMKKKLQTTTIENQMEKAWKIKWTPLQYEEILGESAAGLSK